MRILSKRLTLCLVVAKALLPVDAQAQRGPGSAVHLRAEFGVAKLDWWGEAGTIIQGGVGWAPSAGSIWAIDLRLSQFMGGDGDGENAFFAAIGPEVRIRPASPLSAFVAAHLALGYDQDGGMAAVTGTVGATFRAGRIGGPRVAGLAAPGGSWAITIGWAAGPL